MSRSRSLNRGSLPYAAVLPKAPGSKSARFFFWKFQVEIGVSASMRLFVGPSIKECTEDASNENWTSFLSYQANR